MPSPHWLVRLAVPAMVGAALLASAPLASADPADDAYLAQLRAAGLSWPPNHDEALNATGRLICDDLMMGWTYDQISQNIHATLDPRNISVSDVGSMVRIAHSTYCPTWRCWSTNC